MASPMDDREAAKAAHRENSIKEGLKVGFKAGAIASAVIGIPLIIAAQTVPWAKKFIRPNGQAFIISSVFISTFALYAEQAMVESDRKAKFKSPKDD